LATRPDKYSGIVSYLRGAPAMMPIGAEPCYSKLRAPKGCHARCTERIVTVCAGRRDFYQAGKKTTAVSMVPSKAACGIWRFFAKYPNLH
jgi:hypothetical protein